ncbi:MAG: bifunctional histidinol-phosphatase/imidazoleglycerol-phosphate dehydratase HisB [Steroidobacteraceae bacterium]
MTSSAVPKRVLFIDRDGTLIEEPPDEQIDSLQKLALVPGVIPALLRLQGAGYTLVVVSNQDGLGTASFPTPTFEEPQAYLRKLLESQGIYFEAEFFCPHFPKDGCNCRKPKTGLLDGYLKDNPIDRERSFVIGDRDTDLALAANLGIGGIRLAGKGHSAADGGETWPDIAARLSTSVRTAHVVRKTKETDITVDVNLDREGPTHISTGLGFFDHMIEQIARHGGFALDLVCKGDLEIDEHHTVEDCALALGQALRQALGDKRGIARFGFLLPMDETLAQVAIDLSGRAYFVFEGKFNRELVGQLPTELVPHFFRSLSDTLGAAIHIKVEGENSHHMVEACFKGLGRALRQAVRIEGTELPSSKGVL